MTRRVAKKNCREEENPKNTKKFGGTPPLLDRNHPVEMSRLSPGNVPSVRWTFCPIYVELHRNQVGTSLTSRDSPPDRVRDTSEAYRRPPNSFICVLCLSFCSLIPICTTNGCVEFLAPHRMFLVVKRRTCGRDNQSAPGKWGRPRRGSNSF